MTISGVHLLIFSINLFTIWYGYYCVDIPDRLWPKDSIKFSKGKLELLTVWNMILQIIYFFIALINDAVGTNEYKAKLPYIRQLKDYMFSALMFPSAICITVIFWTLIAINKELVMPRVFEEFYPTWFNHLIHTNIANNILIEMYVTFRKYPSKKNGIIGIAAYLLIYIIWLHAIYFYTGKWVYPIFGVLNLPLRMLFFIFIIMLGFVIYFLGEFLNNKLWSKQLIEINNSEKKKPN